jgi:hypothetical protein
MQWRGDIAFPQPPASAEPRKRKVTTTSPERRHGGPPLLLWTAGHRLIKPMSFYVIRARMLGAGAWTELAKNLR